MDPRGLPMYQHPRMTMMGQSYIDSVPGSIPNHVPMGNPIQESMGMPEATMSDDHVSFTHKTHLNKLPMQQNYTQLPLRKEVDDDGRICGVVLPETPVQHPTETPIQHPTETPIQHPTETPVQHPIETPVQNPTETPVQQLTEAPVQHHTETLIHHSTEGNNPALGVISEDEIKTEETEEDDEMNYFMETAQEIFVKIKSKEISLKKAAEMLDRPYNFVYKKYKQFYFTGKVTAKRKKKPSSTMKKGGRKKGRAKKLYWGNNKPRNSGKLNKCEHCPAMFRSEYKINAHLKLHTEDVETHTCTVCGWVFGKLIHLMRHRILVHEEALQCPDCDMQFVIIASYRHHVRTHGGERPHVCKECGQGYYSKTHLEIHIRKHTGERPFMCGYCEKAFMSLHELKTHQYVHTGRPDLKKFPCEECGKKFESNYAVMEHMNTHTQAKPYACEMCDARFNYKAGLDRHNLTHSGVYPFKCLLCPAGYYEKKSLDQHMIAHSGEKPYKCDLCDYACTRKHTLQYHKYTHTGETPFKCDFYGCTAEYSRPNSLRHHKLQHGLPPPKTCKVCQEKFPDLVSLKRHMMMHTGEKPLTCEQCFKTFYQESSLKRHMYTHMYKPPGSKTKQVRQSRKNPVFKKPPKPVETPQEKWTSEYQVPTISETGQNLFAPSLPPPLPNNAADTNSQHSQHSQHNQHSQLIQHNQLNQHNQPYVHPFTAVSQYSNLVNNTWPTAMDPDELRRRLLSSFK